jgi:hypothetical protein
LCYFKIMNLGRKDLVALGVGVLGLAFIIGDAAWNYHKGYTIDINRTSGSTGIWDVLLAFIGSVLLVLGVYFLWYFSNQKGSKKNKKSAAGGEK